jgi:hypothetical protein
MPRTLANLICEFHAPVQPDDCRQATGAALATALQATGPVVHEKAVYKSTVNGDEWNVDMEALPETEGDADAPPPHPLACDTPIPDPAAPAPTPKAPR